MASPYRYAASRKEPSPGPVEDRGVLAQLVILVLWAISVVWVAGPVLRHEVFGVEPTVAMITVFLLPWMFRSAFRARRRRAREHAPKGRSAGE